MSKFIEEFYYGNIDPQARSTTQNKTVQKQMEVLMLNEDFLTEALTGENKKKFLDFVNAWSIVNGESNLDSFIMSSFMRFLICASYCTLSGQERHSGRTAKRLLNCKSRDFSNRKDLNDVRIVWGISIRKSVFFTGLEL